VSAEVLVRGGTIEQAFIEAVLGLFSRVVNPAVVEPREVREVRAHGDSPEALLAHWIDECSYVHEVEGFVCRAVDLVLFDVHPGTGGEPMRLYAFIHGEPLDPVRHQPGRMRKPASPADITIHPMADGYEIRLMLED
jgi:SHS2 domain-containing protein